MPQLNAISCDKLYRLIGTASAPALIDARDDAAFAADPLLLPGAVRRDPAGIVDWAPALAGRSAVVLCPDGGAHSAGVAALLRHEGCDAEILEGGQAAWRAAGLPLVPDALLPKRDAGGRTVWVTRARPKVDRIACPWLIRRFVDPHAVFLFVNPGDVLSVAEQFGAAPFDVAAQGVRWSHRGELCTFDVMVEQLGLGGIAPLAHLATIVRGADTDRVDIVPEAAGLLAASLGLSRIYADDLEQLEAGMLLYDAFYRWCRDARGETHDWTSHRPREARA
ncbi:chromate resistance protein ChrB domain-containing protein [Sphingomonas psychrotolerans]|uniref:Sulfurtransferase n=1 Tax=Sphingomonas psychrotolerans TaxID=1327635 RepID=A0A2K8MLN1_9SPHN|nr:sulfurtransferase/chromate resistance protein [Sphingomonas psychrotolerans]ATY33904.1 sulfurtransferase [Sphingomonas psychrotolerans]